MVRSSSLKWVNCRPRPFLIVKQYVTRYDEYLGRAGQPTLCLKISHGWQIVWSVNISFIVKSLAYYTWRSSFSTLQGTSTLPLGPSMTLPNTTQHMKSFAWSSEQITEGPQFRCGYWYLLDLFQPLLAFKIKLELTTFLELLARKMA